MSEFGRRGPGARQYGTYLDLVDINIPWLPPKPEFNFVKQFIHFDVLSLAAVDVCVSKIFAAFKSSKKRPNDESDVIAALDAGIVNGKQLLERLDDTFVRYETHAEAPDVFPKVVSFANNVISPQYTGENIQLKYELPRWMGAM